MSGESSYFVDHKRGEVMELRAHLRNRKLDKDPKAKRDVIKKVIAYMTLGIDVSSLFSDMVMATTTRDLVQKKMVYLYLCTYAEKKPDVALLAVNTLQRDCRDDDPMIRGLALRSLCSLRVMNLTEYILQPIRNGLTDGSSYVRKTAVMGVGKLYSIAPQMVRESDLIDILYNILKDKDTIVVANAVHALNEVLQDEGGMSLNRKIVLHLLNRLHQFNEWGQITILSLVARYEPTGPKKEDEIFDIMNLLEDRLRHSNSALVLATTKVFLKLTQAMPNVHREVYKRIKTPLLTLISSPNAGLAYPVIAHVALLVRRNPRVWSDSYKNFYCRFNDLVCIKELKVKILANLVNDSNAIDILNELSEYITDVDLEIARLAIQSIGKIAIRCESSLEETLHHLMSFMEMNQDYIIAETCVCVKNILRKYPNHYDDVLDKLKQYMRTVEETNGKVAVLWILGEYGDTFREAPYILEQYIDAYDDEPSSEVRLQLLTATMKLFFKSPGEIQRMLGRLLSAAIEDTTKIHVRDRAVFYYRLLQTDVRKAEKIVNCPQFVVDVFMDPTAEEMNRRIFDEFNTLAVVYDKPSQSFVNPEALEVADAADDDDDDDDADVAAAADDDDDEDDEEDDTGTGVDDFQSTEAPPAMPVQLEQDVFGMDMLGLGGDTGVAVNAGPPPFELRAASKCTPQLFQQNWKQLQIAKVINRSALSKELAQTVESLSNARHFKTIASGTVNQMMKTYFYGQEVGNDSLHFVECIVNLTSLAMKITVKGQSNAAGDVADLFESNLQSVLS